MIQKEELIRRAAAYLLDIIPVLIIAMLHFVPVLGWMVFGGLATAWWLLRDMNGASLGKSIMGSIVLRENGEPASTDQLILRNVPLAIPAVLEIIPILGILLAPIAALFIVGLEVLMLVVSGRRLGDKIAGTDVFRKVPVDAAFGSPGR